MFIDDEDMILVNFLESEIPEEDPNPEDLEKLNSKGNDKEPALSHRCGIDGSCFPRIKPSRVEDGTFGSVPQELFHHFLKFLSSEDLVSCSMVCRSLNRASSDESLWRRLYSLRWGLLPPSKDVSQLAWKKLYFQRDEEDMVKVVRNCPPECKEYYSQMQASKRGQAPVASQVLKDDQIEDKTIADEVKVWKIRRGLDKLVEGHSCSGDSCSFSKIGDAFICEKTGIVHVCDYTCREVVMDPTSQLLVCTISGHCYDGPASPSNSDSDIDKQQDGPTDEAETFNRLGQFYSFGYNCDDEKELDKLLWNSSTNP